MEFMSNTQSYDGSNEWEVGSSSNAMFVITLRYGGKRVDVKNQSRKRYSGGNKRTVTYEVAKLSVPALREKVEDICSWRRGHTFEVHYHIPGTSPKIYSLLSSSLDLEYFVGHSQSSRGEVVVITTEPAVETVSHVPSAASVADEIQLSAPSDFQFDDKFIIGSRFTNAKAFKLALQTESIKHNYGVKIVSSDRTRVLASCSFDSCLWRVREFVCSDGHSFEIRSGGGAHSCPGVNRTGNKQATSEWIASEIKELVRQQPYLPPKQIRNSLEASHGLSLPYMKLWRSREHAKELVFGSVDDNFKFIPAFQAELLHRNPGSHITYISDSTTHSFQRFFMSFKVCIDGFLCGCRYLIGLDACHLKSKYLGVLMSATSLDGNNGLFTLAVGVAEGESKKSWT